MNESKQGCKTQSVSTTDFIQMSFELFGMARIWYTCERHQLLHRRGVLSENTLMQEPYNANRSTKACRDKIMINASHLLRDTQFFDKLPLHLLKFLEDSWASMENGPMLKFNRAHICVLN